MFLTMFFKKKRSHLKFYIFSIFLSGIAAGITYFPKVQAAGKSVVQKQKLNDLDTKIKNFLEKNPQVVIDVIAKNYDKFTKTVQFHMAKAEKEMTQNIENNIFKEGKKMLNLGVILTHEKTIQIADYKENNTRLALFFDPLCPHCHKLSEMLPGFLQKAKEANLNVAVNLIPVGILDEKNSKALSRIFLSVSRLYNVQKGLELLKTVIESVMKEAQAKKQEPVFTREIITQYGQKLNIDMKALEKVELETGENSPSHHVEEATKMFIRTGYPGVPILVGRHKDNKFSILSINSAEDFNYIVGLLEHGKEEAEKMLKNPSQAKANKEVNQNTEEGTPDTEEGSDEEGTKVK